MPVCLIVLVDSTKMAYFGANQKMLCILLDLRLDMHLTVYFGYTLQFQSFFDLFEHGLFSVIVWSVHQAESAGDTEGLRTVVLVLDQD